MNTPPLDTRTEATVDVVPQLDLDGGTVMVVMVKQAFGIHPRRGAYPLPGAKVRFADEPWTKDAPNSSIKYPADTAIRKRGTDVMVVGSAVAPAGQQARVLDVEVRVGELRKRVRVFGPRVWYRGLTGVVPTEPEPFEQQPVRWEDAFGGLDVQGQKAAFEPRNPVGRGIAVDPQTLLHQLCPSVEDPDAPIRDHRSRPPPAGLGALGANFASRLRYAGTMDQRWQEERFPLRPADFDDRFYQLAPPELISPAPLRGGEEVVLVHLSSEGTLAFRLPQRVFYVGAKRGNVWTEHRPMLDTVLIEPGEFRVELTWRSAIPAPFGGERLEGIRVFEKRVLS